MASRVAVPALIERVAGAVRVPRPVAAFLVENSGDDRSVPFLARYRQHKTGGLCETTLTEAFAKIDDLRTADAAREKAAESLHERGLLSDDLAAQLRQAATAQAVADLYQPFKVAKSNRTEKAKTAGVDGLVQAVLHGDDPEGTSAAVAKLSAEHRTIVANAVSEAVYTLGAAREAVQSAYDASAMVTAALRTYANQRGKHKTGRTEAEYDAGARNFHFYREFRRPAASVRPHQTLALNRGEAGGFLKLTLDLPPPQQRALRQAVQKAAHGAFSGLVRHKPRSAAHTLTTEALDEAVEEHLMPFGERRVRARLKDVAEVSALAVFSRNLRAAYLHRPLAGHPLLAIDPGFRHGCKYVVLSPTGQPLAHGHFMLPKVQPQPGLPAAPPPAEAIRAAVERHRVTRIVIGDGTASRETERLVFDVLREHGLAGPPHDVQCCITSEAGASVYSASPVAVKELPDLPVLVRGAVSIGRRVLDPMAELVKVPPQSLGVGMYQHDVDERRLAKQLRLATESAVASVGVDINTASGLLLQHVPGVTAKLAERLIAGAPYGTRADIRSLKGVTAGTFEKLAGFVRVPNRRQPLDNTTVHPEAYTTATALLTWLGPEVTVPDAPREIRARGGVDAVLKALVAAAAETPGRVLARDGSKIAGREVTLAHVAATPPAVLRQVTAALAHQSDPRGDVPYAGLFRRDVRRFEDLRPGTRLAGKVTNIVAFGAFVNCGVGEEGLAHISAIHVGEATGQDALALLSKGEVVACSVKSIDGKRLGLVIHGAGHAALEDAAREDSQTADTASGEEARFAPRRRMEDA